MDDRMWQGFAALPAEIVLDIAGWLADLGSLHRLLQASPAFRHLSDDSAILISLIDEVLKPMPEQIQAAVRVHFRLRTGCLPVALEEKANLVRALGMDKSSEDHVLPNTLADVEASPSKIRGWLAAADHIESLAHTCLQQCLENCRKARLARLRDPDFRYPTYGRIWNTQPEGDPYIIPPEGLEPPSWIEEQRALRITWLLHVSYELGDRECKLIGDALGALGREQLLTVRETTLADVRPSSRVMTAPTSGAGAAREPHFASLGEDQWEEGRARLKAKSSFAWGFFHFARTYHRSPLQGVSFAPYRRLGFAMWNRRRMTRMGFLDPSKAQCHFRPDGLLFMWRSVLTAEEDEQVGRTVVEMTANRLA